MNFWLGWLTSNFRKNQGFITVQAKSNFRIRRITSVNQDDWRRNVTKTFKGNNAPEQRKAETQFKRVYLLNEGWNELIVLLLLITEKYCTLDILRTSAFFCSSHKNSKKRLRIYIGSLNSVEQKNASWPFENLFSAEFNEFRALRVFIGLLYNWRNFDFF